MQADPDILNWSALTNTPVALEQERVENGEPVASCGVAGLQYYSYRRDDGLGGRISPQAGDRLVLVREPDNRHDRNAVEVWWRNQHRLGHLPCKHPARAADQSWSGCGGVALIDGLPVPRQQFVQT